MALKKTLPTQYGVDASYWKIVSIYAGYHTEQIAVAEVRGWQSQADMLAGCAPIGTKTFAYGPEIIDFNDESQPVATRTIIYALIKQPTRDANGDEIPSEFADATDC